jgi:hypothetical protein
LDEGVEEVDTFGLVALAGVVALAEEDGDELGAGCEVGAGLADGLHAAVELGGSGAQAVGEHACVGFVAESGHGGGLDVGGQCAGPDLAVEGVDVGVDGGVLVGDDTVGDAGVGEGHLHRAMPEQGGDRFESHPAVDRLGGQGVAELVGVNVADSSPFGDPADDAVHGASFERGAVVGDQSALGGRRCAWSSRRGG